MFEKYEKLCEIYEALENSNFVGRIFLTKWNECKNEANCVFESLDFKTMTKIFLELGQIHMTTNFFHFFERREIKKCVEECQERFLKKMHIQQRKEKLKVLNIQVQINHDNSLKIVKQKDGTSYYSNPDLHERKYYKKFKEKVYKEEFARMENMNEKQGDQQTINEINPLL